MSAIPSKTKGEATWELIRWIGHFINPSNWAVKRIQTNNVLEFATSKEMAKFVTRLGIVHKKSAPYEHHQNGSVERTNQMLNKMCCALVHT